MKTVPVRTIQSKQNPRLKQLRRALATPAALAGIEGPNLLEEAIKAQLTLECVFVAEDEAERLDGFAFDAATEVLALPRELLRAALATETPQTVAALVRPPVFSWADILDLPHAPLIVILAGVQDPGNLGTILRSAEAFGATGVIALPGTVNAWNPKAVRASAGSLFRLPYLSAPVEDAFARLHAAGIKIWTTAVHDAFALDKAGLVQPTALIIGNEGNGVPEAIAAEADAALTIPCPGPVESLNAAVAASILLYEASRQRAPKKGNRR
jgi:RNA methyltransferase, TrmH family